MSLKQVKGQCLLDFLNKQTSIIITIIRIIQMAGKCNKNINSNYVFTLPHSLPGNFFCELWLDAPH